MSELRRFEAAEAIKSAAVDGVFRRLEAGDTVTLPKAVADRYIARGWGRDPDTGEQGERRVRREVVEPAKSTHQAGVSRPATKGA